MLILIVRFFVVFLSLQFHAFYVSVCEIYHNPKTNSLEITIKIFTDDLELAIQNSGKPTFKISEEIDQDLIEKEIQTYLKERLKINLNSKTTEMTMIGFEYESDAILCYLEIENVRNIENIHILNSILTEVHEDQVNLSHFQYNGKLKSLKTTKDNTDGTINCSDW